MLEVRKRQQLSLRELYQVNWFLGAGLALLALWPAFFLDFEVLPHVLLATTLIGVALVRPQITALLPRRVWQTVPFFLVILLALDLHLSPEPVPALIRLNILLVVYRCLAFRRKREDLQLIVLCLFLLIIAGVLTVNLAFVAQILLFTAVAMSFLFNITLMENSRDMLVPKEIWRNFTWRRFLRKLWNGCDPGFCIVGGVAFISVVVCSILLFLLIPRFDVNNPIPFFGINRASQTGFSESIRFGDVTNIRNNDRVALRVEASSAEDLPADPYWRMLVLDEYNNGGFHVSRGLQQNHASGQKLNRVHYTDPLIGAKERPSVENLWTFYLEGGVARYLPLAGVFQDIRFQEPRDLTFIPWTDVLGISRVNSSMLVYRVENMEVNGVFKDAEFGTYSLDYDWYPDLDYQFGFEYINYPDTTMALPRRMDDVDYLLALVDKIGRGEALTAAEFAARATAFLQRRHSYSMSYEIPSGDGDHVVRWLKSGQPGHCEVFAGALLLLSRAAGIPARIVTGFRGGSWNGFENYFMVRHSDAHAWVEIFDGRGHWLRFDPTPGGSSFTAGAGGAAEQVVGQVEIDSSMGAYVDSLRILWYRRIVSFDQKSQFELLAMVRETYEKIDLKAWLSAANEFLGAWWRSPWDLERVLGMLWLLGFGGLLSLLASFCLQQDRLRLFFLGGPPADPVRRHAGKHLQRLLAVSAPHELEEPQARTFRQILLELQRLRYGPPEGRDEWREVIRRARRFSRSLQ